MKFTNLTKRLLGAVLIFSIFLTLSACTQADNTTAQSKASSEQTQSESEEYAFTKGEGMNVVSLSGEEYEFLAMETELSYIDNGELKFEGSIKDEEKTLRHLGLSTPTGLYSINGDKTHNILIRIFPDNEWYGVYRKCSLPPFDFSIDNCSRLELIFDRGDIAVNAKHLTCGRGMTDRAEIAEFLADVRSQKDPKEAGLYDLVRRPEGTLDYDSYKCIYGYFEEEPKLVIHMRVNSYNIKTGKAYSVRIGDKEYVLPKEWIEKL